LVMKYADGGTLADWFNAQPGHENGLPLETLLPIFRPLAEALDLAHRNGILHRDVKPQNIMFMGKTPVLIDFGIAARIRPENVTSNTQSFSRTDTMAHSSSGTPRYMAPEQMEGKSQNSRTDQYALAMTLYEMLTGSLPFSGGVVSIVLQKSRFDPQLPQFAPHVNAALARALSFNAADRFSTCAEFIDALTTPLPEPAPKSVPKTKASHLGVAVFLLLALFAGLIFISRSGETVVRTAGERMVKTVDGIEYAFRWCPPGSFLMGSPEDELGRYDNETQHSVTLTQGFWMLETEVTQAMWESVMGNNPSYFKGAQNPVEQVSWTDCDSFCKKLSSKLGVEVSLPTEAQWEYACRAGTTTAYSFGSSASDLYRYGNYCDSSNTSGFSWQDKAHNDGHDKTAPVKSYSPNAWGLYDMHGNVWEWCSDWHGSYSESPTSDPTGPNSGSNRVNRGGGWDSNAEGSRSAYRDYCVPGFRYADLGFRIVLADPAPGK
ncbi:MAG: SUMF1/EgtB/PvdO family nonheme iron enzyme, partial [Thermoguttaceae bacterium]|nr:SUMF1/EgtB/PvdO family nonheme iron enzyme [Thermoguttaceae bacterium]